MRSVTPHLRYLRYVLLHKFYVLRAGLAIAKVRGAPEARLRWWWRLLVHDWSKFTRAEWTPYVDRFYGETPITLGRQGERERVALKQWLREANTRFNAAWLHHIHRNPHHWQHHILHEDSGKVLVLVPHAALAYEMVADWLAAGPKVLRAHTMAEAVAETIAWYARMHDKQLLRGLVRAAVEACLLDLAEHYGVTQAATAIQSAQRARASITIPGR